MLDFCLSLPYAAFLGVRGVLGWTTFSSILAGPDVLAALVLGILGTVSLKAYKANRKNKVTQPASLCTATCLLWLALSSSSLGPFSKLLRLVIDGGMVAFYVWNVFFFQPSPAKKAE